MLAVDIQEIDGGPGDHATDTARLERQLLERRSRLAGRPYSAVAGNVTTTLGTPCRRAASSTAIVVANELASCSDDGSPRGTAARWYSTSGVRIPINEAHSLLAASRWWILIVPPHRTSVGQIGQPSGRQIVDHIDRGTICEQPIDQVRPDESGASDHHCVRHTFIMAAPAAQEWFPAADRPARPAAASVGCGKPLPDDDGTGHHRVLGSDDTAVDTAAAATWPATIEPRRSAPPSTREPGSNTESTIVAPALTTTPCEITELMTIASVDTCADALTPLGAAPRTPWIKSRLACRNWSGRRCRSSSRAWRPRPGADHRRAGGMCLARSRRVRHIRSIPVPKAP